MAFGKSNDGFAKNCGKVEEGGQEKYVCTFEDEQNNKKAKVEVQATKDGKKEITGLQSSRNVSQEEEARMKEATLNDVGVQGGSTDNPYEGVTE